MNLIRSIFYPFAFFFFFAVCCTPHKKNKNSNTPEKQSEVIAHGTVKIVCSITELKKVDDMSVCVAKIDKVVGYGAGTRPISSDTNIELLITESLKKELLEIGLVCNLTIKYSKEIVGRRNEFPWQIVNIETKEE